MTPEDLFAFGNSFVLIGWILLLLVPNWKYTQTIVLHGVALVLAVIYIFLIAQDLGDFDPDSFGTLEQVKVLFQSDSAVAAGWFHYLTFDLLVGAYIVKRSNELNISRWKYTLVLPFTFMFGPIGYLLFVMVKTLSTKSLVDK